MPLKDPQKRKEYHRNYVNRRYKEDSVFRTKHRERTSQNDLRYLQEKQIILMKFRSLGCVLCNETESCCLDAHHLDPNEKDFALSQALYQNKCGIKKFQAELNKCICVCRNCHAKIHAGIKSL
jgi:hypothetical protein